MQQLAVVQKIGRHVPKQPVGPKPCAGVKDVHACRLHGSLVYPVRDGVVAAGANVRI